MMHSVSLRFNPRMAKVFADAGKVIQDGFQQYLQEVTEPRGPRKGELVWYAG